MVVVAAIVYAVVLAFLALAAVRRRAVREDPERIGTVVTDAEPRRLTGGIVVAVGITVVILIAFLVADFGVGRAIAASPDQMMTVDVVGHQWWWEVHYADPDPSQQAVTANEIHVPVGVPVQFRLSSRDVIHSFWAPNLRGKKDLIPGYGTSTWFQADTPGVYRGQCAEYCGFQHAKMAFYVVAESRKDFDQWLERQRQPALPPRDSVQQAGYKVFMAGACSSCHSIGGTDAHGTVGPDLTHVASRLTLAAGAIPNRPGYLAGWIVDPQGIKPGTLMPSNQLGADQLEALLHYLGTLK